MKVTLQIDGKKRTFSNVENISIEEENVKSSAEDKIYKVSHKPTEGQWFEVKPLTIDQNIFKEEKEDSKQEATRKLILEAFEELKNNPEKYGKKFKVMMLEKTWTRKSVNELKELAYKCGDRMANWVEQALEWAQRIANGESWETICNQFGTANWYRAVIWKAGGVRLIGDSVYDFYDHRESDDIYDDDFDGLINHTVPLVVLYEK